MSGNKTPLQKLADESIVKYNPKFASPLKTASDFEASSGTGGAGAGTKESPVKVKVTKSKVGIFAKGFIHWKRSKDVSGANAPPAYVIIQAPTSAISFPKKLQERVCSRLQKLSKRDYLVLGDRILRDHFNEMSERIFEPLPLDDTGKASGAGSLKGSSSSSSSRGGKSTSGEDEEDEYEEVEVEVEGTAAAGAGAAGGGGGGPGPLSSTLKILKSSHDTLQISTFRNFMAVVFGCVLLLCNRLISLPPLWLIVLILTGFFVPSSESFDQFIASQTATGSGTGGGGGASKKVKKMVKRKKVKKGTTAAASASSSINAKPDYSGVWKRTKAVNFEAFASAQGAGYVQRKLAASIDMVVTITMDAPHLTSVRIQEDGGPVHSDNTMVIGGEASEASLGQKVFADSASWYSEGSETILQLNKILQPKKDYEIVVRRYMEDNGQSLRQIQTFIGAGADGKRVECQTFFTRVGNSSSAPPVSVFPPGHDATTSASSSSTPSSLPEDTQKEGEGKGVEEEKASGPTKSDFSGVWTRFKSHNMDMYAGALGAGYMQRKLAGSISMEHTITMNPPDLSAFRLQEVGGPLKTDTLYTIDATEPIDTKLGKNPYQDMVHWRSSVTAGTLLEAVVSPGPTLVTTKTPVGGADYTVYQGRYLEDANTLVVVNIHYNHTSGAETVATNWFKLTGPSPNPTPVPPLPIKQSASVAGGDGAGAEEGTGTGAGAGALSQSTRQVSSSSSSSLRVDFSGVWERQAEDSEKMMSSVMKSDGGAMKSTHTITMDTPALSTFHLTEVTSSKASASVERSYSIGGEYIETSHDGKAFKEKCYWLGEALVIQRLSLANDVEIIITRYLENASVSAGAGAGAGAGADTSARLRLVTVRKNLNTGDNTESVSFFTKQM